MVAITTLPLLVLLTLALTAVVRTESEGSGSGDEGLVDCRKLAESIYTVFLGSHDSHTLKCLKQCPAEKYRWFHGFTTRDDLSLIRDSYELTVVMAHPPRHTDVGHFCCGCVGDRPKESCCVGVAHKPEVTNFTMSQGGESVKGVHVGANVTLTCEAYAYPSPLVEILRDGKKVEGEGGPDDESWYSYKKTVEVSSVTEDHSGGYTCRANITLYQNGEELNITSDELQPQNLIVYDRINISNIWLDDSSPEDNLSFVCLVEAGIPDSDYSVSWLFNNKPISVDGASKVERHRGSEHRLVLQRVTVYDNGLYTCVVSTPYQGEENRAKLDYKAPDVTADAEGGRNMPHNQKGYSNLSIPIGVVVILVVMVIAVLAAAAIVMFLWKCCRRNAAKVNTEEDAVPLDLIRDRQQDSEGSEVEADGLTHAPGDSQYTVPPFPPKDPEDTATQFSPEDTEPLLPPKAPKFMTTQTVPWEGEAQNLTRITLKGVRQRFPKTTAK